VAEHAEPGHTVLAVLLCSSHTLGLYGSLTLACMAEVALSQGLGLIPTQKLLESQDSSQCPPHLIVLPGWEPRPKAQLSSTPSTSMGRA
jgi:hypothetical protein